MLGVPRPLDVGLTSEPGLQLLPSLYTSSFGRTSSPSVAFRAASPVYAPYSPDHGGGFVLRRPGRRRPRPTETTVRRCVGNDSILYAPSDYFLFLIKLLNMRNFELLLFSISHLDDSIPHDDSLANCSDGTRWHFFESQNGVASPN